MSNARILTTAASMLGAMLLASAASTADAHPTDVHHWFEHERALSDGGDMLIESRSRPQAAATNGGRGDAGVRGIERGFATAPPDCFMERLQFTEGSVPSGRCSGEGGRGSADQRWIRDEDEKRGRHAEQASGAR